MTRLKVVNAYRRAGEKTRDGFDEAIREGRPKHPARHARQQQRRNGQREKKVLDHVRAEEIVVAQVVQRTIERDEHQEQPGQKVDLLAGGGVAVEVLRAPHVYRAQRCDADDRTRVNRPSRPGEIDDGMQQRQDQHAYMILMYRCPNRNISASSVSEAMSSGPVNSTRNSRWSYLRCM